MKPNRQICSWSQKENPEAPLEKLLTHRLQRFFPELSRFSSTRALKSSALYQQIRGEIEGCLNSVEYGFYGETRDSKKKFYRTVLFNLSGEIPYRTLYDVLKHHPILSQADFYFFIHADLGMARTDNQNLIRALALEFSYHYVFAPSYLSLMPDEKNQFGLVGHAVMSRFPIESFQILPMTTSVDAMKLSKKCFGSPKALFAKIRLQEKDLSLLCLNLDPASSSHRRVRQMVRVLRSYDKSKHKNPILLGGEWNTTTYNTCSALNFLLSYLNKILRGFSYISEEHHPFPERYFDRTLFENLKKIGLHFEDLNQIGKPTVHRKFFELETPSGFSRNFVHKVINRLQRFAEKRYQDFSLKTDWFAGTENIVPSSQPEAERPKVLSNVYGGGALLTRHHPLVLDFEIA